MAHLSRAVGGEWQRSTRLTGPDANTVNLYMHSSLYMRAHAHTHTSSAAVVYMWSCLRG